MPELMQKESVSEFRIRELMVRWEIWRDSRRREMLAELGYGPTMIGKCLSDMPSTVCTLCRGRDENCALCDGVGKIMMDPNGKICPAFIRSTHRSPDDETSERVDRIMCELRANPKTLGYYLILLQEYTRSGNQQIKADRIHLTFGNYRTKLHRAHRHIQEGLIAYI